MRVCIRAKKKPTFTAYMSWNGLHYYCPNCTKKTFGFKPRCERCRIKMENPTEPYKILALDKPDLFTSKAVKEAEKDQYRHIPFK